jgi:hypothetical protein
LVCFVLCARLASACSSDDGKKIPADSGRTGDGPKKDVGSGKKLVWVKTTVDSDRAGKQAAIGGSAATLGVAYFRELTQEVVVHCPAAGLDPASDKPRPAQDLMYAAFDGTSWGTPVKVEQTIGVPYGISVAFDRASGKAYVGYLGGEVSKDECASSDAVIASSADGKSFIKRTVSSAGPIGDTVGYWMSVALDGSGQDHAAYGDVRFGYYEQDGKAKASARYDSEVILANNGAGVYNGLAFDPQGRPVVALYNPIEKGTAGGVQLAVKKSAGWDVQQLIAGATSERMSLGTDGKGRFGLAYYEPADQLMRFTESAKDLAGWADEVVDPDLTHNGEFSSLAYDSQGNPGVSYYRCGKYKASACDAARDALMFAYRVGGQWTTHEVDTGDSNFCGTYTSLTFAVGDKPVIAYQCVALNNTTNEFVAALKVAQGAYQ